VKKYDVTDFLVSESFLDYVINKSDELKAAITRFVDYYNNERYHESLDNLTPADVYLGRGEKILTIRKQIKKESMLLRRKIYEQYKMRHARNTNIFLFERPHTKKGF
jgi:hypothetical protein